MATDPWFIGEMNHQKKITVASGLTQSLYAFAPTDEAVAQVMDFSNQLMADAGDTEDGLDGHIQSLANALADGLNHGNWPWTNYKVK